MDGRFRNPEKPYKISDERFYTDTDKWENEVKSLSDLQIFTFIQMETTLQTGTLIQRKITVTSTLLPRASAISAMWMPAKPAWIQMGHDYLRMARRNLDGYRLYEDMIQEDPAKKRLSDLFDSSQIFDTSRPTPVTWNYGQTQNETPANETTAAQQ